MLNFEINKTIINKNISKNLPLSETVNIKDNLPENFSFIKSHIENPVITINQIKLNFETIEEKDIEIDIKGYIILETLSYSFNIQLKGELSYKNQKIYYKAHEVSILPEKNFSYIIKEYLLIQLNKNKIISKVSSIVSKIVDKAKDKLNYEKELIDNLKDNKLDKLIHTEIEKFAIKTLEEKEIFAFNDSFKESLVKNCLKEIKVSNNGINIFLENIFIVIKTIFSLLYKGLKNGKI